MSDIPPTQQESFQPIPDSIQGVVRVCFTYTEDHV